MSAKNVFYFDAETDGLYGAVWAIGAVVQTHDGVEIARFAGQVDPSDLTDGWVRENIAAHIKLPRSPVESGLFRACVEDSPAERTWEGPYPLHEVATLLLAAGIDPDIDRVEFSGLTGLTKHNPIDDSLASAACWRKARKMLPAA